MHRSLRLAVLVLLYACGDPPRQLVSDAGVDSAADSGIDASIDSGIDAPSNLTYSTNPATYTKATTIAPNTPSYSGGAVISYAVLPSLPAGLSLDTSTGVITGTPTARTAVASYTVTA